MASPLPSTPFSAVRCASCDSPLRGCAAETYPVTLTCGHSLCRPCGDAIATRDVPVCPFCNIAIKLPLMMNMGLGSFAEAALANMELLGGAAGDGAASAGLEPLLCVQCKAGEDIDTPATHRCKVCPDRPLCSVHGPAHSQLRKHEVEVVNHAALGPSTKCTNHPECSLNFFCLTDMTAVCRDCVVIGHSPDRGHDVRELGPAAEVLSVDLRQRAEAFRTHAEACTMQASLISAAKTVLLTNKEEATRKVDTVPDKVAASIATHVKTMLATLDSIHKMRSKALTAQSDELLITASQLGVGASICENAIASCNPLKVTEAINAVKLMNALTEREFDPPVAAPWLDVDVDFQCLDDAIKHALIIREVRVPCASVRFSVRVCCWLMGCNGVGLQSEDDRPLEPTSISLLRGDVVRG